MQENFLGLIAVFAAFGLPYSAAGQSVYAEVFEEKRKEEYSRNLQCAATVLALNPDSELAATVSLSFATAAARERARLGDGMLSQAEPTLVDIEEVMEIAVADAVLKSEDLKLAASVGDQSLRTALVTGQSDCMARLLNW